jgi:hypothetical protein
LLFAQWDRILKQLSVVYPNTVVEGFHSLQLGIRRTKEGKIIGTNKKNSGMFKTLAYYAFLDEL